MNFDDLQGINEAPSSFNKIQINSLDLCEALNFLKNDAKFAYDRLNTIIAVDLGIEVGKFELIYDLHSTQTNQIKRISILIDRNSPHIPSVVEIYKSAYFDECEIYDMFGIIFDKNPKLKRLLMPKGWIGYPLRKDYKQTDERLAWSLDE